MISRGADIYARCRWTQMTPLHYAALFDSEPITKILLNANQAIDIDSPCNEYENGSALHIAAHNLAVNSALVLVEFGANTKLKDNLGRTPLGIKQLLLISDARSILMSSDCRMYSGWIKVRAHSTHGADYRTIAGHSV